MEDAYKVYLACGNCGRPFVYEMKKHEMIIRYDNNYLRRWCECPHCGIILPIEGYGSHCHTVLDFQTFERLREKWKGEKAFSGINDKTMVDKRKEGKEMRKKNCLNCRWVEICKYYERAESMEQPITDIIECITDLKRMKEEDYNEIRMKLGEFIGGYCRFFEEA